jgi:hypoxanthine phosphoribosyltransferase
MQIPKTYEQLASSEKVNQAIADLAASILRDFADERPLFVQLLRGAQPFASKLMSEIARQNPMFHPELDSMIVTTYGAGQKAGGPHIVADLAPTTTVKDRTIIILDDVLDKGITANFVKRHLAARQPRNVRLAVLAQKTVKREIDIVADYCGFTFSDDWLVGMGMDDASAAPEGYRWIDEIWKIKREV